MVAEFKIEDIYDKNINFLIGSGASYGLFPTLQIGAKNEGKDLTIEVLATQIFEKNHINNTLLFMHYYVKCIDPILDFSINGKVSNAFGDEVLLNYEKFLKTTLNLLQHKRNKKRCNIFTTNYDSCFYLTADRMFKEGKEEFSMNDGVRGFMEKTLSSKNFNSHLVQSGVFERFSSEVPQINLMHLHGSIFWQADGDKIIVDYKPESMKIQFEKGLLDKIKIFSTFIEDSSKDISELPKIELSKEEVNWFWGKYNLLPIVNPTKKKFSQTLFEEHYYHMLRFLSYELESDSSIFAIFGFSFADEHIENIVKRSLSNPSLQIYIFCFNDSEKEKFRQKFSRFKNVCYVTHKELLSFSIFNNVFFNFDPDKTEKELNKEADNSPILEKTENEEEKMENKE